MGDKKHKKDKKKVKDKCCEKYAKKGKHPVNVPLGLRVSCQNDGVMALEIVMLGGIDIHS
jgi:hypothetical protein